jgi:hypothetical protein
MNVSVRLKINIADRGPAFYITEKLLVFRAVCMTRLSMKHEEFRVSGYSPTLEE